MVINYQEVYMNLNIKINKAPDNRKIIITRNIIKLQEWINTSLVNKKI